MRRATNEADSGYPTAYPFASNEQETSSLAQHNFKSPGAANDGAHTGTTPLKLAAKRRMQLRDIEAITESLSRRDIAILGSVALHRFLSVRHVEALHFADHAPVSGSRIARRTLERLRDLRLLGTLERRIGGVRAGSAGLIHYLGVVGDQVLHGRSGRRARRFHEPSTRFLGHWLAIADTHVALVQADQQRQLELVECAVESASWRGFPGLGGARLILKPDLYVETAAAAGSDLVHGWFVEVDLGNETITTILKKCRDYEDYRRTGIEQGEGGGFPIVVWRLTHPDPAKAEQRRQALREAIDADRTLPSALFRVVGPDQLVTALASGGQP